MTDGVAYAWPATYTDGVVAPAKEDYALKISGLVEHPQSLPWSALLKRPLLKQRRRIVSAQGWTYRGDWEGILLKELLEEVRPKPEATVLRQIDLCGNEEYISLQDAIEGHALLGLKANGHALPPLYGGPIQLLVFHRYSYKGLGQLRELIFEADGNADRHPGRWELKGYEKTGTIRPGQYYAFDLGTLRPVDHAGEITAY